MVLGCVQRESRGGAFCVEPEKKWSVDRDKTWPAYSLYHKVIGDNDWTGRL